MKDKIIMAVLIISSFSLCLLMSFNNYNYIKQLESDKAELQTKINLLKVDIESSKNDLKEAHEWLGIVFEDGAIITDKYNELKTKCKKARR